MEIERTKLLAKSLISNMDLSEIPNIKSAVGVVNFACQIVEELKERTKYKLSSEDKRKLATFVLSELNKYLLENKVISKNLSEKISYLTDNDNIQELQDIIDDTVNIWNEGLEVYETIKRLCFPKKVKKRRLQYVQASIALEVDPLLN